VWTAARLRDDVERLGIASGDVVMVHASLRSVGRMQDRGATLVDALLSAVGPDGTIVAYTDWDADYDSLLAHDGRVPLELRERIPPFDARRSSAAPSNGALAEIVRTWGGAVRSGNPGASVAAIGARAAWITADHPLDYGYGPGSPLAKLVEAAGLVLMIGAPLDTMTLLHHAEHLADIPGKRVRRFEAPLATPGGTLWRMTEEYETSDPVVDGLPSDYFKIVVEDFIAAEGVAMGEVGDATAVAVSARRIVRFAVRWLESCAGPPR
jgi:aminoglycoside 3-N-acetyltransferase